MNRRGLFKAISLITTVVLISCVFLASQSNTVRAASYVTVTKTADTNDGDCSVLDCSLREAIAVAGAGTYIRFADSLVYHEIILTLGELSISKNLTIDNSNHTGWVRINGNNNTRILFVNSGISLTVKNMEFYYGTTSDKGAAIKNDAGTVTIYDSSFYVNIAASGGALSNEAGGVMTVYRSTFISNSASSAGGVGGAIRNMGTLSVYESEFVNNVANYRGGGIYSNSSMVIEGCEFHNNVATNYEGGGISNFSSSATITNSTFYHNTAGTFGGGIGGGNGNLLTLNNNTFSGNVAPGVGAGGGLHTLGSLTMRNTILANSEAAVDCYWNHLDPPITSHNLIEANSPGSNACGNAYLTSDPVLLPLADNSGNTSTMALSASSPAINQGDDSTCLAVDARGVSRPQGSHCDIGAFEYIPLPVISTISPDRVQSGVGSFILTVNGSNFTSNAVIMWNATNLATTFVNSNQLTALVSADLVDEVNGFAIKVNNPGFSNIVSMYVHSFADVVPPIWHWGWVEGFYAKAITTGCSTAPLRYCPDRPVTRAEMAVFILRSLNGTGYVPPDVEPDIFTDVPVVTKEWMEPWIEQFYTLGITTGCANSPSLQYCPERQVTRAEMAVFILRAKYGATYTPPPATNDIFTDILVANKEWMVPWIEQFYREGITTGCATGLYCPEQPVTRAEMAVFIDRAFGFPQLPD